MMIRVYVFVGEWGYDVVVGWGVVDELVGFVFVWVRWVVVVI